MESRQPPHPQSSPRLPSPIYLPWLLVSASQGHLTSLTCCNQDLMAGCDLHTMVQGASSCLDVALTLSISPHCGIRSLISKAENRKARLRQIFSKPHGIGYSLTVLSGFATHLTSVLFGRIVKSSVTFFPHASLSHTLFLSHYPHSPVSSLLPALSPLPPLSLSGSTSN